MNKRYAIERINLSWLSVGLAALGVFLLIDAFVLNGLIWHHYLGLPK